MADPHPDKKAAAHAVSWQQPSTTAMDEDTDVQRNAIATSIEATDPDGTPSRQLEIARRWLLEDKIRDAPPDEQRAFLKRKGISDQFIDRLLVKEEAKDEKNSKDAAHTPPPLSPHPAPSYETPSTPPVVTYPEFLIRQKNPPIVTPIGLLTTAYIAGAIGSTIYGVSKFLIEPMFQQLTEARHDMSVHTSEKLEALNARLLTVASKDPSAVKQRFEDDDTSSLDSEPTELFSHDAGTQTDTTPPQPRQVKTHSTLDTQLASIRSLRSSIQQLADMDSDTRNETREQLLVAQNCSTALDSIIYQNRYDSAAETTKKKKDVAAELTAEIRSVKGALLNMRFAANIPTIPTARVTNA